LTKPHDCNTFTPCDTPSSSKKPLQAFSALVPDLPGCIATSRDQAEVKGEMKSAVRFNINGLKEDVLPVPHAKSIAEYVEV
jgi:predicted RNase H-like HicB family nuclease